MDRGAPEGWPASRWGLSAPESYALLYGPQTQKPAQPLKLAVLELILRRVLVPVETEQRGLFGSRRTTVLVRGPGSTDDPVLLEVLGLYSEARRESFADGVVGVEVSSLAERASRRYGAPGGFTEAVVMGSLARRGLFERKERRLAGLFPYRRWEPTAQGEAARADLAATKGLGETEFCGWVDREPERALAFLGLVGPAVLLMEGLRPELRRMREAEEDTGHAWGSGDAVHASEGPAWDGGDPDWGVLGDLDGAFEAVDSGMDGDGGDGGGD